jgi:hypothetical protein
MFRTGPLLLALTLAAQTALAQQAAVSVRGRVVDAENNRPLRRTIVSLARGDRSERPVLTDEEGRFEIQLPDSSSALVVAKAGYASTIVEPDRRTVRPRELDIRLPRGAAMSGRVLERGTPAIGSRVIARRIDDASSGAPTYEAEIDDLGEYRIGGLPAGQYTVSAGNIPQAVRITPGGVQDREAVQGIASRSWQMQIYPGLTPGLTYSTRLVDVRPGEETVDVDFTTEPLLLSGPAPGSTASAAFLKSTEQDPGAIAGRVVTHLGQSVGGAMIVISGSNQTRMVVADPDGRFDAGRFKDGDYRIETGRYGYFLPDPTGQVDSGTARMVHVGGDTRVHDVEIVLTRGGAVTGTIVDSAGEPFQGVLVRALRLRQEDGRMVARPSSAPRLTDDRGRYRVFGLPPGAYLIAASLDATERALGRARPSGFTPVYYPGTAHVESSEAVQIELGGAIAGVDFPFAVSATVRVTGTALNAAGQPLAGRVTLGVSQRSGSVIPEPRVAPIGAEGAFELADIPPGDYVLQALGDRAPGTPPEFGSEYVTVADTDPPPLTVKTTIGATLDGRFVADGRSSLPMFAQSIHAAPIDVDRSPPNGRGPEGLAVHEDGRFYLTGLYGPMRLTYPALPGWYLKSVTIGGVDVTDTPFDFAFGDEIFSDAEIVLSNAGATIAGSIEDAPGKRATTFTVVTFSVSRTDWFSGSRHIKRAAGANGSFEVSGLPPGEYFVAAVSALPRGDLESPETLDALVPYATRVTAREGQVHTIDLRLNRR